LQDKIKCVLSNGLENVSGDDIDDILIAGMGGELIANILSSCSYVKDKHLILNPMTHSEITREWLYSNGFEINNDIVVNDGNHHYNVFDAVYSGNVGKKCRVDYYLGNIKDFSDKEYFEHLLNYLKNKQKGGEDFSDVINAIEVKL
jgi:tRNA (adenine22-N1)-methyltransferase